MADQNRTLTTTGRWLVLITACLGWYFAGMLMSTTTLAMRSAAIELLGRDGQIDLPEFDQLSSRLVDRQRSSGSRQLSTEETQRMTAWRSLVQAWFAYYQCAMLFGAAAGGLLLGRIGDRIGRSPAMAASILCFSTFSTLAYFVQGPVQLLVVWFLACLGVGGMWPNGVALLSETWSNISRPMIAGIMGTAANIGIFSMATLAVHVHITPEDWRWTMLVCASPIVLGLLVLIIVPESPSWQSSRDRETDRGLAAAPAANVFRPPMLSVTLIGIVLAATPLIGGWGSANWMVPWAAETGQSSVPPDLSLQARVHQTRSVTGIAGSLVGGWAGYLVGRRLAYCLASTAALFCAQYIFWFLSPTDKYFLVWVAGLGFFSGLYFGWLPLFLPELFPIRVRSTGAGVSFNFGRIVTAGTIFATGALVERFGGDYAAIGRVTSLIYLVGALVIWMAPDTSRRQLGE